MDLAHWNIWERLTFKTNSYRKNFDFVIKDENIITEYSGNISMLRLEDKLRPLPIGDYSFSIWNLDLAKLQKSNVMELIEICGNEPTYLEMLNMIKEKKLKTKNYQKIIFLHTLVLHPEFRKKEITEEFIEFIYRDYYSDNVGIYAFVMPIQDNNVDFKHYMHEKDIIVHYGEDENAFHRYTAFDYFKLKKFEDETDTEINEYKLFSVAQKCGFDRINESHLFIYSPENTLKRIEAKYEIINNMDEQERFITKK